MCSLVNDMPTFKELSLNVIHQYAAHWEDLGALLELKPYKIANIARDHHNQSVDACREMLMLWLQVDPSPTWGKLDAAIRSLITTLASNLTGMYICQLQHVAIIICYSMLCVYHIHCS